MSEATDSASFLNSLTEEKVNTPVQIASLESCHGRGLFALGSYQLNESTGRRSGNIGIYNADCGSLVGETPTSGAGVLDMKWWSDYNVAAAMSDATLVLLAMNYTTGDIKEAYTLSQPDEGLFLSVQLMLE